TSRKQKISRDCFEPFGIGSDVAEVIRIVSDNNKTNFADATDLPLNLPVNTAEEFMSLAEYLCDKENKDRFTRYLKGIGGADTSNFVTRILGRVIGGDLANASNFNGKGGKVKFEKHALMDCILGKLYISILIVSLFFSKEPFP
ncbi:unnamed protein product, partial [Allacma fusca]